jgi:hypothetical protein
MKDTNISVVTLTLFLSISCLGMENEVNRSEQRKSLQKIETSKIETPTKTEFSSGQKRRITIPVVDHLSSSPTPDTEDDKNKILDLNNNHIEIKKVESSSSIVSQIQILGVKTRPNTPNPNIPKTPYTPYTPKTPFTPSLMDLEGLNVKIPKRIDSNSIEGVVNVIHATFPNNEDYYAKLVKECLSVERKTNNNGQCKFSLTDINKRTQFFEAAHNQEVINLIKYRENPSISPRDEKNPSLERLILGLVTEDLESKKKLLSKLNTINKEQEVHISRGRYANICALLGTFVAFAITTGTSGLSIYFYILSKNCK